MKQYIGKKVLITTNNWFYAPDGKSYRGVWGTLKGLHEAKDILGFPIQRSVNWIAEVGDMVIMGCQIHYIILSPTPPPDTVEDFSAKEGQVTNYNHPSYIYNADNP